MTAASPSEKPLINKLKEKQLVLFDFDGTITTRDTLAEFMIFYHGKTKYYLGLAALTPILASYVFKLMPNWKSKQYFLTWFLKGENVNTFNERCAQFSATCVPALIRPGALKAIEKYKKAGATIAVVSASAENWIKPWCDENNLICIATQLEVRDEKLTGRILGKNCHGSEKVCRIEEKFFLKDFTRIIAYGDTAGDHEMLQLAHEQHYKPFR
jgi:phosphatidylglycerophosphatase C